MSSGFGAAKGGPLGSDLALELPPRNGSCFMILHMDFFFADAQPIIRLVARVCSIYKIFYKKLCITLLIKRGCVDMNEMTILSGQTMCF